MNDLDSKLLTSLSCAFDVKEVQSSVIPGPPPEFRQFLFVNCRIRNEAIAMSAEGLLSRGRTIVAEVLKTIGEKLPANLTSEVIAVQLVLRSSDGPLRVYRVAILFDRIRRNHREVNETDIVGLCENEFSMLDRVAELIAAS